MKETVRSLQAYFILSGLASGAQNVLALQRGEPAVFSAIAVVGVGFAAAYVYAGVRLRPLIASSPGLILRLLIAGGVFLALLFGIGLLYGMAGTMVPRIILGLLITWYLFVNVRRLAAEAHSMLAAPVNA